MPCSLGGGKIVTLTKPCESTEGVGEAGAGGRTGGGHTGGGAGGRSGAP